MCAYYEDYPLPQCDNMAAGELEDCCSAAARQSGLDYISIRDDKCYGEAQCNPFGFVLNAITYNLQNNCRRTVY